MTQDADRNDVVDQVDLVEALVALAHPQRLRIVAALADGRNYVSQLARDLRISRPLLHMHLARLEAAGLVRSEMEVSEDGKAMRFVVPTPFSLHLSPESIARAVAEGALDRRDGASGRPNA